MKTVDICTCWPIRRRILTFCQTSVSGAALAAASLFSSFAAAVQPLTVDGANFITNSTGNRFTIIGVE